MSAIDYDKESDKRLNWLDLTGGTAKDSLTVLDAFALEAMGALLNKVPVEIHIDREGLACAAYNFAEVMLAERTKCFTPQNVVRGVTGRTYG